MTICGCATPTERIDRAARGAGFVKQTVSGDRFDHLVLTKISGGTADAALHIYIEGDGSAWIANRWIAADPTPRKPVALELMRLDPGPALYLGRPCYFELRRNCTTEVWTAGRYSAAVVQSMAIALEGVLDQLSLDAKVTLIGHSGGGVLAMLLAARIAEVDTLVTLAANLDVDRWRQYHRYSPLSTSLDPAREAPLPAHVTQIHLVGGKDQNVPFELAQSVIDKQANARVLRYAEYDHNCCWTQAWPAILERLAQ